MNCKIIDINDYRKFSWYFKQLSQNVYQYDECEEFFEPVFDETRFADGMNFVCHKCGHLAGYVRLDGAEMHKSFIVVHIICAYCGNRWKKNGIEPFWQRVLEDQKI